MQEDGTFDVLPKKEVINLKKELEKLQKNLGGIKEMKRIPDAIFIVDPKKERICVQEAHALGITCLLYTSLLLRMVLYQQVFLQTKQQQLIIRSLQNRLNTLKE